jgi:flagellin
MVLSVNTNAAALNALQNLNRTTFDLDETQLRVNTGLKVKSAKDNAAVFAIAQNLRADRQGLEAVKSSLDRAKSVLDVSMAAMESIQDILIQMKEKVVGAADEGLDQRSRDALAEDFVRLRDQITLVASNATFNGTNLINGAANEAAGLPANLVAIVSPDASNKISVPRQNLALFNPIATATGAPTGVADTGAVTEDNATTTITGNVLTNDTNGAGAVVSAFGLTGPSQTTGNVDNVIRTNFGYVRLQRDGSYTYTIDNTLPAVQALNTGGTLTDTVHYTVMNASGVTSTSTFTVTINGDNEPGPVGTPVAPATTGGTFPPGTVIKLTPRSTFQNAVGAQAMIKDIDDSIRNLSQSLTAFGAASKSMEQQRSFIDKLGDTVETGIGNLVDADLSRESARLQSLQVKQQLGLQALSIANRQPQSILSLFQGG